MCKVLLLYKVFVRHLVCILVHCRHLLRARNVCAPQPNTQTRKSRKRAWHRHSIVERGLLKPSLFTEVHFDNDARIGVTVNMSARWWLELSTA